MRTEAPWTRTSTLSSDPGVQRSLRRLQRAQRDLKLRPSHRAALPFLNEEHTLPELLLDSTVYIDQLQGKLPSWLDFKLRTLPIWHSTVTECELAAVAGLLDPDHPRTRVALSEIIDSIGQRRTNRILNPDREIWREAGMIAGLLARLQHYGKADQRRTLNDALILLSAAKAGLTVLTRNVSDYDLLLQLAPHGKAIFYDRTAPR